MLNGRRERAKNSFDNMLMSKGRTGKGLRENVPVTEKARNERFKDGISKGIFHPTGMQITSRKGIRR